MKRTSSGTPPGSPSPIRRVAAEGADTAPTIRRARVRPEWNGMHHPGRPTVAVLVVGSCEEDAARQQLVDWQRRAREVDYNYCVVEAGDANDAASRCADVLRQHVPADATVVMLQGGEDVPPADIEKARSALGFAGLVRRSQGPFLASDGNTPHVAVFPSEASLARQAMNEGGEPPSAEVTDRHAEAAFEARQQPTWREQRIGEVAAKEKRIEALTREVQNLADVLVNLLPAQEPATAPPPKLQKQLNILQFKPHWQARASTPQATRLLHLLLRVGSTAKADPGSPAQLALHEIVRAMVWDADDVDALLAAVDHWPADVSDQALLIVLMRALREHEVAAGACDVDPVNAPRQIARWVTLHDRLQALAASVFDTLGRAPTRSAEHEARLRDYVEQAQLALLLGEEDALPDAAELSAPGFDPVAGVLFAAMLQVRRGIDDELDAFMAQWAPWQTMVARRSSQGRWPPDAASTDSD